MSATPELLSEYSGALVLLGAFHDAGVDVANHERQLQRLIETTSDAPAPDIGDLRETARHLLEKITESAVTTEEYTRVQRPAEGDAVPHPASKRQCVHSINQLPS